MTLNWLATLNNTAVRICRYLLLGNFIVILGLIPTIHLIPYVNIFAYETIFSLVLIEILLWFVLFKVYRTTYKKIYLFVVCLFVFMFVTQLFRLKNLVEHLGDTIYIILCFACIKELIFLSKEK